MKVRHKHKHNLGRPMGLPGIKENVLLPEDGVIEVPDHIGEQLCDITSDWEKVEEPKKKNQSKKETESESKQTLRQTLIQLKTDDLKTLIRSQEIKDCEEKIKNCNNNKMKLLKLLVDNIDDETADSIVAELASKE